ncbi:hypothetical protein [uncultured Paludibaculum sp.]|uniref:hypothetical protein n=1 Tax=uncultured Paludibaculum sp. TaxID=1765020 RepID=UPI002AAB93BD|nr:hypothetical protein [uncultured Paludibaculum sp.]
MKTFAFSVILLAVGSTALSGQRLLVYSEFQRVRPDGEVVAADRVEHRREILSPAVVRNSYATWRIAVEAPAGAPYHIYLGQNPDETVKATLYQEEYTRVGAEWIPDRVKPVALPHSAALGTDQKVQTYLLDVWLPESTPMARFRLEIQLNVGDRWVIYPMEVRVMKEMGPGKTSPMGDLPPVEARTDAAVRSPVCEFLSSTPARGAAAAMDRIAAFVSRNVRQDVQLARPRDAAEVRALLLRLSGFETVDGLCKDPLPAPSGAEWWLRVRDNFYRGITGE